MINPANPVGAFLQGNQAGQQYRAGQQQMDLQRRETERRDRAEKVGMNDQTRQQQLELLGEIRAAGSWVLENPAEAPQRLVQVQNTFRPIFGDAVDSVTLEALPGLVAQAQQEFANNMPSNIREWEYFNRLSEPEQQQYLNLRRGGTVREIGGVPTYVGGGGGIQTPLGSLEGEAQAKYTLAQAESEGRVPTGSQRGPDGRVSPQPGAPLSPQTEQRLVESTAAANQARSNAQYYSSLADELAARMPPGGVAGEWAASLRSLTGSENADDLLRRRWAEVRVSNAIQNLPPGVASDKDIELVMSAFLPTYANADTISSFVRGLAKIEELQAEYHEFEADWYSQNGTARGLSQAWREYLEQRTGGQGGQQAGQQQNSDPLGIRGR